MSMHSNIPDNGLSNQNKDRQYGKDSEEVKKGLLEKVEKIQEGDMIILNDGRQLKIIPKKLGDKSEWRMVINNEQGEGQPISKHGIEDLVNGGSVDRIVLISRGEIMENDSEYDKGNNQEQILRLEQRVAELQVEIDNLNNKIIELKEADKQIN